MGRIISVNSDGVEREESKRSSAESEPVQQTGALPNFVIIGAQKSGTSSLYHLLSQHPYIRPAVRKELPYFSLFFDQGVEWYRSCFPAPEQEWEQDTITGEASPYYLFHPHAPRRMSEEVPRARLIVLLRNPVDRAYSHYQMIVKFGREPLTFEEALAAEEERLGDERAKMIDDEHYRSFTHQYFSYLSRGIYVDQLIYWSKFFDSEQTLVLKSEDFFERTPETLRLTLNFLGMPEREPEAWEIILKGEYDREMEPATRQRLEEYFDPHNHRLYKYLGVDLGW